MITVDNNGTIRWIIRSDIDKICKFDDSIQPDALIEILRDRSTIGILVEQKEIILGYCLYSLANESITIVRIVVDENNRRQGIGRILIDKIKTKLDAVYTYNKSYKVLVANVKEDNIVALNFFKAMRFKSRLSKSKRGGLDMVKFKFRNEWND